MPHQREAADVALEIDPETGRLAYREVRVGWPRQSGKTQTTLSIVVTRALGSPRQNIRYAAQTGKDSRTKWEDDWLPILDKSRFAPFYRKRLANGHEALLFTNGSIQSLLAATEKSGHGGVLDLAILDEAFALPDARLEQSAKPAMMTRPQPQLWIISTAGTPRKSPYLYGKVLSGRKIAEKQQDDVDARRGVCYIEYSAPDESDIMDPRTWWECMPALGYTVTEQAVAADLASMMADEKQGLSEFERAYGNRWVLSMGNPIVSLEHWRTLARDRNQSPTPPWCVFGVAVAPRDEYAAVVAAGEDGHGAIQTTVLEHGEGVDWLLPPPDDGPQEGLGAATGNVGGVDALRGLVERYQPQAVIVDEKQCAHILPELERACGFQRVRKVKLSDVPSTCAFWLRLCQTGRLYHRDESELTVALAAAERRIVGDAWAFSQSRSGADITPLVAQTLAVSNWLGSYGSEE